MLHRHATQSCYTVMLHSHIIKSIIPLSITALSNTALSITPLSIGLFRPCLGAFPLRAPVYLFQPCLLYPSLVLLFVTF